MIPNMPRARTEAQALDDSHARDYPLRRDENWTQDSTSHHGAARRALVTPILSRRLPGHPKTNQPDSPRSRAGGKGHAVHECQITCEADWYHSPYSQTGGVGARRGLEVPRVAPQGHRME